MEVTPPFDHSRTRKLTTRRYGIPQMTATTRYTPVARTLPRYNANPHTVAAILDNLANNAFLTYKALRSAYVYSLHAAFVNLSPLSLLSPPLSPWYLGCINKIVGKIVFAHFLPRWRERVRGDKNGSPRFSHYSRSEDCFICDINLGMWITFENDVAMFACQFSFLCNNI